VNDPGPVAGELMLPTAAVICTGPVVTPVASPCEPVALLTVATAVLDDVQVAVAGF
jgi:hypothetical protein